MEYDKCPYCKKKLEKVPLRKKKGDFCGKFIYVRKKPNNMKKVLIMENEIEKIEKEWINYAIKSDEFVKLKKSGFKKDDFINKYYFLKDIYRIPL